MKSTQKRGRPSKYKPEYVHVVSEYVNSCKDVRDPLTCKITDVRLPMIEELCQLLEVSRDTVYEWGKRNPDFKFELDRLKQRQFVKLIHGGLSREYNQKITALLLRLNHGLNQYNKMDKNERLVRKLFNSFSKGNNSLNPLSEVVVKYY